MKNSLLTDNEITRLREKTAQVADLSTVDKWQLCQELFRLVKKTEKDKEGALEGRREALMKHEGYSTAWYKYREAKLALEKAEAEATGADEIKEDWDHHEGVRICRNEELRILQGLFNKVALACKRDPLQSQFSLFVENEGDTNRFGDYYRYDLGMEAVGRFYRGKNRKDPVEYRNELMDKEEAGEETAEFEEAIEAAVDSKNAE